MDHWLVLVILVCLIEHISSNISSFESEEYPLAKSLGYSIKKNLNTRVDPKSQEFMKKYEEMRKASQESFENFGKKEEKRHRRVIVTDELDVVKEVSLQNRRRSTNSNKLESAVGSRRARSQALRRNKLNNQSLKSHMHHFKQTNPDYFND